MNTAKKSSDMTNGVPRPPEAEASLLDSTSRVKSSGEHFVQFYENDDFLIESVATFVGGGLGTGESAIVIATPAHREGLARQLSARGFDLEAVQSRGQYVPLDAAETLSKFMVDGLPDETLFMETVGKRVAKSAQDHRGLRAFGEMVALLWAEGKPTAAIRLEQLWNDLGKKCLFSLFCAYPMTAFRDAINGEHFAHICCEHSRVVPSETFLAKGSDTERLRAVADLQRRAGALELEISRRKQAEEESRIHHAYLKAVIDNTPECVKVVAADGTLLNINKAGLEMVEADSVEQVLGTSVFDLIAPDHRDAFRAMHERVCAGSKEELEYEIVGLKKARRWLETHAVPIADPLTGQQVHLAVTRDISERRVVDGAQRRLAAIVESSDDAIASKDLNGIITSWNKGAERLFGYTAEEIIGRPVTLLIPAERQDEEPGILERIRNGRRIDHFETVRRRKDGTLVNVSLTVSPIKDAKGKVVGASKIARDITDKIRAKEKLEQMVAERTVQLRDLVAELEAFSYSIAHDMRAPLRAMTSFARLLEEDCGHLSEKEKSYTRRISSSAERLDRLIQDVLNYSKITRGEMLLEPVDVEKLVREIVESYSQFQEAGATILIQSPMPRVLANTAALTQCISNLLSNAVKFVRPGFAPQVRVWAEPKGNHVRLWFQDNGIGISEEGQKRIFRMFQRLNPANEFEGNGIGLTIVRKAVERMGGRIGVDSVPGVGSNFWIELKQTD